jgi:PBP1b-binding outer membrane lipoprotein LpoB
MKVAEKLAQGLINTPELKNLKEKRQFVTVQLIQNQTNEYFDTRLVTYTVLRKFIKNGIPYFFTTETGQSASPAASDELQANLRVEGDIFTLVTKPNADRFVLVARLIDTKTATTYWTEEFEIFKIARGAVIR